MFLKYALNEVCGGNRFNRCQTTILLLLLKIENLLLSSLNLARSETTPENFRSSSQNICILESNTFIAEHLGEELESLCQRVNRRITTLNIESRITYSIKLHVYSRDVSRGNNFSHHDLLAPKTDHLQKKGQPKRGKMDSLDATYKCRVVEISLGVQSHNPGRYTCTILKSEEKDLQICSETDIMNIFSLESAFNQHGRRASHLSKVEPQNIFAKDKMRWYSSDEKWKSVMFEKTRHHAPEFTLVILADIDEVFKYPRMLREKRSNISAEACFLLNIHSLIEAGSTFVHISGTEESPLLATESTQLNSRQHEFSYKTCSLTEVRKCRHEWRYSPQRILWLTKAKIAGSESYQSTLAFLKN